MKPNPHLSPSRLARTFGLVLLASAWIYSPLAAQETAATEETPAPPAPAVPEAVVAPEASAAPTAVEAPPAPVAVEAPAAVAVETPPPAPATPVPSTTERIDRREIVTIGGSAHLQVNETAETMVTIMGDATVDGRVRGECVTVLGNVTVNGRVDGELVCILGRVTLGSQAEIRGEVVAVGGGVVMAPGAVIRGEKVEIPILGGFALPSFKWLGEWFTEGLMWGRLIPPTRLWAWAVAGVILLLNIVIFAVFRRPVESSAAALERKPAMAVVNGLLLFILIGPLVFLLLVSVIGILVVPFLIAGLFLASIVGMVAVYRFCGGQLGLNSYPLAAMVVGNVLFTLLYAVWFVGFAIWMVTGLVGVGAVMTALIDSMRRESRSSKPGPGAPPAGTPRSVVPPAPTISPGDATAGAGASGVTPALDPAAASGFVSNPANGGAAAAAVAGVPALVQVAGVAERIGFWPRAGATALDFLLVGGLTTFLGLQFLFPYVWLAYHIAFWAWRATTIGGIVLNLRIERLDGRPIDYGVATVRSLASIFSGMVIGLGFMWASWDEERQSWHDKIAGTTIVRVPRGQPLF